MNDIYDDWISNKFEEKVRYGIDSYHRVVKDNKDAILIYNGIFDRLPDMFKIKHNPWDSTDKTQIYDVEMILAKPYLNDRYIVYFQYKGSVKAGKLINFHIYDFTVQDVYYLPDITLTKVSKDIDSIDNFLLVVNQIRKAILQIQDSYSNNNEAITVHLHGNLSKYDTKQINDKRTAEEVAEDIINNISGGFSRLWKGFLKWLSTD